MEAVAAGDEIALDLVIAPVVVIAHAGMRVEAVQAHVVGLEDCLRSGGRARVDQVLRHLGLAIDHDSLPSGQRREIDAVPRAAEENIESLVDQTFAVQPRTDAGVIEHLDRPLLEHPGANAAEHVLAAAAFDDDRVDAGEMQQLPE